MHRTNFSANVSWLGKLPEEKILATYQGKYFVICKKCSLAKKSDPHFDRKGNYLAQLTNQKSIDKFKKIHDVSNYHQWTLIHISRTAQYIQKQMIGGKICQMVTI